MERVLIIGWDGATFDLIRPWAAAGKLPHIAKLMQDGVHGPLRSTLPPMTFPAWSSFLTGKNPGKHGIYDFTRPKAGTYDLELNNGSQRRATDFWQLLSRAGRQVISISIPCTFPPEPVNGVMISGFDAPGLAAGAAAVDARGMYPPGLYDELTAKVGPHPIGAFVNNQSDINRGRPDLALEEVSCAIRAKAATAKYLMATRPWDCCMILFGESDGAGHHFWKYCDRQSPLFQDVPAMSESILQTYQELDREVGELVAAAPPDTTVLMMSDHGFGGVSNAVLYPNCWLAERGFLRFRGRTAQWWSRTLDAIKMRAVTGLPGWAKRLLVKMARRRLGGYEARVRFGMIDWSGTQAYFEENPYYPAIYLNVKGRQPKGVVEPGAEYDEVRDRLIRELESWRHPDTGEPVVQRAYRREDVYSGPFVSEAPDVVVHWGLTRGYSYAFRLSNKSRKRDWLEHVDPNEPQNLPFFTGKSGHHRDDGIFVGCGPALRPGATIEGARIIDLAPTILHLLGVPVPSDMDGRVLRDVLTDACAAGETVVQAATAPSASAVQPGNGYDSGYSAEDEAMISERLQQMGYIE